MSTYIRVLSSPASVSLDQHSQPATLHVTGSGIRMTDRLAAAIDAVCNKGVSLRRAAAQFGIAKSKLYYYVSGKVKTGHKGPAWYLSEDEEDMLVSFIEQSATIGYPKKPKR